MDALARVELGGKAPAELLRLLPALRIEPLGAAPRATVDFRVELDDVSDAIRRRRGLRVIVSDRLEAADGGRSDFVADDFRAVACFILSRALRLPAPFVTADLRMFETIRAAVALARGPAKIIVEGETGSGKASLIRLIHAAGGDSRPLREIDCPALDESTIARELTAAIDELRAGAGTGPAPSPGYAGAIFLHRMGELSLAAQRRILEILQGCPRAAAWGPHPAAPIRFFAAASHDLAQAAARGEFLRELRDFFDLTLTLPPMRARPADLPLLARHYLRRLDPAASLAPPALKAIAEYRFPGNVRELINLITRLAIAASGPEPRAIGRAEVVDQLVAANPSSAAQSLWRLSHTAARRMLARSALAAAGGDAEATARNLGLATPVLLRLTTPGQRRPGGDSSA